MLRINLPVLFSCFETISLSYLKVCFESNFRVWRYLDNPTDKSR